MFKKFQIFGYSNFFFNFEICQIVQIVQIDTFLVKFKLLKLFKIENCLIYCLNYSNYLTLSCSFCLDYSNCSNEVNFGQIKKFANVQISQIVQIIQVVLTAKIVQIESIW